MVATTVSYGHGFGRFGETGPVAAMIWAVCIWIALRAMAVAWMKQFRFGPFEWLLRSFTYGERQPLRR